MAVNFAAWIRQGLPVARLRWVLFGQDALDLAAALASSYAKGAESMRERCAVIVDQCNRDGPYNAIGAAKLIRSLPSTPAPHDKEKE